MKTSDLNELILHSKKIREAYHRLELRTQYMQATLPQQLKTGRACPDVALDALSPTHKQPQNKKTRHRRSDGGRSRGEMILPTKSGRPPRP